MSFHAAINPFISNKGKPTILQLLRKFAVFPAVRCFIGGVAPLHVEGFSLSYLQLDRFIVPLYGQPFPS